MHKFIRSGGLKFLFAFLFLTVGFAVQSHAQVINEILNKVEAHRKTLQTLRANITMGKYDPSLKEWTTSKGIVIMVAKSNDIKSAYLRIDWSSPREEVLAVADGKYVAYTPGLKQAYVGAASESAAKSKGGSALDFLSMSKSELNANYDKTLLGEESVDGTPTWHLVFKPKSSTSKYKSADIWVDQNGMIIQAKTSPTSGDETNVKLSGIEKNVTLKASQFKVSYPSGTKVIKG